MGFVRNAIYTIDSQDNPSGGSTTRIYKGFIVGGKVIEIVKACM